MIADEILVQRYLAGERDAFRQLVERHTPALFNLAFRLTRDREEAADITQEAFRRAFEALPTSRTDLPFKPWLFQIAVNLCRDWAKRQRPLALADLSRAPEEGEEREPAGGDHATSTGAPARSRAASRGRRRAWCPPAPARAGRAAGDGARAWPRP